MVRKVASKPEEKVDEKKDLGPDVQSQAHEQHAASLTPNFGWAVNAVKLNRAKAFVNQKTPGLKGKELETAVKERYVELKGLLSDDKPTGKVSGKGHGRTQNLSENDGSDD